MSDFLIKMIDGGIRNIDHDTEYYGGYCSTCDYGSYYVTDVYITMSSHTISLTTQSGYSILSVGFLMKLFLQNVDTISKMTEDEFDQWIKVKLKEETGHDFQ